jgi:hypothetical protein
LLWVQGEATSGAMLISSGHYQLGRAVTENYVKLVEILYQSAIRRDVVLAQSEVS